MVVIELSTQLSKDEGSADPQRAHPPRLGGSRHAADTSRCEVREQGVLAPAPPRARSCSAAGSIKTDA